MREHHADPFRAAMLKRVRRQFIFAAMLFALFVAIVLAGGKPWSWTLATNVAAVGVSLFVLAAIAWLGFHLVAKYGRRGS